MARILERGRNIPDAEAGSIKHSGNSDHSLTGPTERRSSRLDFVAESLTVDLGDLRLQHVVSVIHAQAMSINQK